MIDLFLFYFETTQCKNRFDTKLVKIHKGVIKILSFSCSALFLVTANGGHLGMPNCKKSKHSGTKLDQFQPVVLEILSFLCLCFLLVTAPGGHLDRYIFI